jgi:hypothetical protein
MRKPENPCAGIVLCPSSSPRIAFIFQLLHIDLATKPFDAKRLRWFSWFEALSRWGSFRLERRVLMEINGRPWGSIGLPIASGIDYPRYLIDWCLTGALPPKTLPYRTRITCRRLVGELTHLSNIRNGKPANWPEKYPHFWSTLAKVAMPWYPGMRYDDIWLSDLRPGIEQIRNWFRVRRAEPRQFWNLHRATAAPCDCATSPTGSPSRQTRSQSSRFSKRQMRLP